MDRQELKDLIGHMNLREIWINIEDILSCGFSIEEIMELGEPYDLFFADYFEKILSLGADPKKLFNRNESWYARRVEYPKDIAEIMQVYQNYGLDQDFIKNWLKEHIHPEDFIQYSECFKPFGIELSEYIEGYLDHHRIDVNSLPAPITPNDIINHFSIDEIKNDYKGIGDIRYNGFGVFVKDFIKAGGDVSSLADKFLAEKGYPEDEDDLMALAIMLNKGATQIDANRIIDALKPTAYCYYDRETIKKVNFWFYEMLEEFADEAHLKKLTT